MSGSTNNKLTAEEQRKRRREFRQGYVAFIACGIIATIGNAVFGGGAIPGFLRGELTPVVAVGLVAAWIAVILLFVWFGRDMLDEHETSCAVYGQSAATGIVVFGYPVWFLLWKGGLIPEPSHVTLFATLLFVSWAGFFYKKYR